MKWAQMKHRDQVAKVKAWEKVGVVPLCPYCNLGLETVKVEGKDKIGCPEHGVNFKKRMRRWTSK
jgi:hypothetical protein